jgi:hypothetical protein
VLTQSFPATVEPTPYELEPVAFATEPVTFEAQTQAYEPETGFGFDPVAHEAEPQAYNLDPVADDVLPVAYESAAALFEAEQVSFDSSAPTFDLEPEVHEAGPVTFDLEPVAEPVGESFAWSPWAQEMGLGEAPVAADADPEPFAVSGFADMVEDAGGHGHTEAFPVPQAPVDEVPAAVDPAPVDEVAQFMPQPRDPGDGVVDPSIYAQALGAHSAASQDVASQEAADGPVQPAGGQAESVPDPLAGGLLAHLMSSVRGL